jgi:signal transduction histidine kinase
VTLDFADNGIGIPDKEKKRIFEKFYRIGSEETRQTKGTGLGLFIVEQVVKAHNGHIQVLDNQPKGTIFRIVIRES